MMPHEQTWAIVEGECGPELDLGEDSGGFPIVNKGMWGAGQMPLARAAPEMARLLLEWREREQMRDDMGEADRIEVVLRAAGVLP